MECFGRLDLSMPFCSPTYSHRNLVEYHVTYTRDPRQCDPICHPLPQSTSPFFSKKTRRLVDFPCPILFSGPTLTETDMVGPLDISDPHGSDTAHNLSAEIFVLLPPAVRSPTEPYGSYSPSFPTQAPARLQSPYDDPPNPQQSPRFPPAPTESVETAARALKARVFGYGLTRILSDFALVWPQWAARRTEVPAPVS